MVLMRLVGFSKGETMKKIKDRGLTIVTVVLCVVMLIITILNWCNYIHLKNFYMLFLAFFILIQILTGIIYTIRKNKEAKLYYILAGIFIVCLIAVLF